MSANKEQHQFIKGRVQMTITILMKNWKVLIWDLKEREDKPEKWIKKWDLKWRYNFPWWKQDLWESIEQASIREVKEEVWITVLSQEKVWMISFDSDAPWENNMDIHVFVSDSFTWKEKESNELIPKWIWINEIDYTKFFPADSFWIKDLLEWKQINYYFKENENYDLEEDKTRKMWWIEYDLSIIKKNKEEWFLSKFIKTLSTTSNKKEINKKDFQEPNNLIKYLSLNNKWLSIEEICKKKNLILNQRYSYKLKRKDWLFDTLDLSNNFKYGYLFYITTSEWKFTEYSG